MKILPLVIFLIDGITFSIIDCDTETDDPAASRPVFSKSSAGRGVPPGGASMSVPTSEGPPSVANSSFGPFRPRRVLLLHSPPIAAAVAASASAGPGMPDYYSRGLGRGRGGWGRGGGGYGGHHGAGHRGHGGGRSTGRGGHCMLTACSISHISGMFTDTVVCI